MALPYYLTPSASMMTPVNDFYPIPASSYEQVHQIQRQHNIYTMAYLQGMHYPPPTGYALNYPTIFAPQISNFVKHRQSHNGMAFSHSMPNVNYPISPVPLRPLTYTVTHESTQSYRYQLRQVAKRVATSDACAKVESKQLKANEAKDTRPLSANRDESLKVIPEDMRTTSFKGPIIRPESKVSSLLGGPYIIPYIQSSILGQTNLYDQNCTPESDQQHISKMRALVEGIPGKDTHSSPSTQKFSKEKKTRPKSKARSLDQLDALTPCKKRKIADTTPATPLYTYTSNWYPKVVPYTNEHLMIEANATILSKSFYATIPWESCEKSTRMLVGHFFSSQTLATHNLEGESPLNSKIVEDIINHVSEKCRVGKDYVRSVISAICAEAARMCLTL